MAPLGHGRPTGRSATRWAPVVRPRAASGTIAGASTRTSERLVTDARIGINLWSQAATWPELLAAARRVDRLGYDSVWTWDHLCAIIGDPDQPVQLFR